MSNNFVIINLVEAVRSSSEISGAKVGRGVLPASDPPYGKGSFGIGLSLDELRWFLSSLSVISCLICLRVSMLRAL